MEVETAVRRQLLNDQTVNGYVDGKVFKYRLEGTLLDDRAVVVNRNGGWGSPPNRGSAEYPILDVDAWCDHERNGDGTIARANGEEGAWALYRAINALMHGVRGEWWGAGGKDQGLMIVSCARFAEPSLMRMEGMEAPFVRARYALQVAV